MQELLVYHGSANYFDGFALESAYSSQVKQTLGSDVARLGHYFTDNIAIAQTYPPRIDLPAHYLYTCKIKTQKLRKYTTQQKLKEAFMYHTLASFNYTESYFWNHMTPADLSNAVQHFRFYLMSEGYDVITFKEGPSWNPTKRDLKRNVYIPLDSNNIEIESITEGRVYNTQTDKLYYRTKEGNYVENAGMESYIETFFR